MKHDLSGARKAHIEPKTGLVSLTLAISVVLAATLVIPGVGQSLTADVEANGFSFSLAPATTSNLETVYFTSYDGLSGVPLLECDAVSCYAGEECSPSSLGSNSFATDYLIADSIGVYEYGSLIITASMTDGDGNGQLDALERLNSGNFSVFGTTYPDWNAFALYYNSSPGTGLFPSGPTCHRPGLSDLEPKTGLVSLTLGRRIANGRGLPFPFAGRRSG